MIGVSNATEDNSGVDFSKFPSPLEETGVSNQNQKKYSQFLVCFRPLSRRLGFLTNGTAIYAYGKDFEFPSPLEETGVSNELIK